MKHYTELCLFIRDSGTNGELGPPYLSEPQFRMPIVRLDKKLWPDPVRVFQPVNRVILISSPCNDGEG